MLVGARLKGAKISAQKARLVADQIRGKKVGEAVDILSFSTKKGAHLMKKLLESAIANAEHNEGADIDADTLGALVDASVVETEFQELLISRHDLPEDQRELAKLAYLLGYDSDRALLSDCLEFTRGNRERFESIFTGSEGRRHVDVRVFSPAKD